MTILVFTATYGNGPDARTLASVAAQENAPGHDYHVNWLTNPIPGRAIANVLAHYHQARRMCLDGGYEALLTVEDDMIIEPYALRTLYATDAGVAYGVYLLRHGAKCLNAFGYKDRRRMGATMSLRPEEAQAARARGWAKVSGVGWGCTLIRREVLERIAIRGEDAQDAGDMAFAGDCLRAGVEQVARFDVLCGHIDGERVLWPFQNNDGLVGRVYALRDAPLGVQGNDVPLRRGRYYSFPLDVARALARAGYARVTNYGKEALCLS